MTDGRRRYRMRRADPRDLLVAGGVAGAVALAGGLLAYYLARIWVRREPLDPGSGDEGAGDAGETGAAGGR